MEGSKRFDPGAAEAAQGPERKIWGNNQEAIDFGGELDAQRPTASDVVPGRLDFGETSRRLAEWRQEVQGSGLGSSTPHAQSPHAPRHQ
jgi:hypothetical protein